MARPALPESEEHLTAEITLRARYAWALKQLKRKKGGELGSLARWAIESWIDSNDGRSLLLESFGIDIRSYETPDEQQPVKKVVSIKRSEGRQ
jgi:hypothetical protein